MEKEGRHWGLGPEQPEERWPHSLRWGQQREEQVGVGSQESHFGRWGPLHRLGKRSRG